MFQSYQGGNRKYDETISISTPPIVDVIYKQTQKGDRRVDVLIEKTRMNLTVSFAAAFSKFAIDAIPVKQSEGGFINHGYVGDLVQQVNPLMMTFKNLPDCDYYQFSRKIYQTI